MVYESQEDTIPGFTHPCNSCGFYSRGEGGVMHLPVNDPPSSKRSGGTRPFRIDSDQKRASKHVIRTNIWDRLATMISTSAQHPETYQAAQRRGEQI
jgi:hypothetical protein